MVNEKSQIKGGLILNYINIAVGTIIPIFYTPIMLELLGQAEYGLFKLANSTSSYLSLISLGIGSSITRYLIKEKTEKGKESEERVLGLFSIIFDIIALLAVIVGVILAFNIQNIYNQSLSVDEISKMRIIILISTANTAISFIVSPYLSTILAHERFIFNQSLNIVFSFLGPIINIIALYLDYGSVGLAFSSLFFTILNQSAFYIYVIKKLHIRTRYKDLPLHLIKEILCFSFWIFLANIVSQLYNATDTVLIGMVPELATTGVAIYSVGATLNNMATTMTTAISNLMGPKVNKMVFGNATDDELNALATKVGRIQCIIMTLIVSGFVSFGKPFVCFYAGEAYFEAYWVAIFMLVPNIIPLSQSVYLSITVAKNKHQFRSIVYLFIAILNVIGTWLLMKPFGVIGAALMTGIATIIGHGFLMNWYYKTKIGVNIFSFWRNIIPIVIVAIVTCAITLAIGTVIDFYNPILFIIGIAIYTLVFTLIMYCFVLNEYEKSIITNIFGKIKTKLKK